MVNIVFVGSESFNVTKDTEILECQEKSEASLCQLLLVSQIITRLSSSQRNFASLAQSWLKKKSFVIYLAELSFTLLKS